MAISLSISFTEANGDVLSRVKVRINEVFESMNIIDYMVDNLPSGEILKEGFNYTPGRFALGITEAPRGEDIHWSMLGDNQNFSVGVVVQPLMLTGQPCVICCVAIRSLMRRSSLVVLTLAILVPTASRWWMYVNAKRKPWITKKSNATVLNVRIHH